MYTVVLRRYIDEEHRDSYSAVFHSEEYTEAKAFAAEYSEAKRYDILLVVRTEFVTSPEDDAAQAFVADSNKMLQCDTHVKLDEFGYINVLYDWENGSLALADRLNLCYDTVSKKLFMSIIMKIMEPFLVEPRGESFASIGAANAKLLEFMGGRIDELALYQEKDIMHGIYKTSEYPYNGVALMMYHALSFAIEQPNVCGFIVGSMKAGIGMLLIDHYEAHANDMVFEILPLRKLLLEMAYRKHGALPNDKEIKWNYTQSY